MRRGLAVLARGKGCVLRQAASLSEWADRSALLVSEFRCAYAGVVVESRSGRRDGQAGLGSSVSREAVRQQ